jgi:heat-inducible transcriptional repressor
VAVFGAPLTSRQVAIVLAVVREHVRTREPVGSRAVRHVYGLAASTATIRNDMVELEQAGYIRQPHTSAGRIPCDAAYRLYVNVLSQEARGEPQPLPWLQGEYRRLGSEPHELLRATSRLLSRATSHPAVVTQPPAVEPALAAISLQPASTSNVRLTYHTVAGEQRHHLLRSEAPLTADLLGALTVALQKLYVGRKLAALASVNPADVQRYLGEHLAPESLLAALREAVARDDESAVYVDGASYILDEPEFEERSRLKQIMQTLDEDAALRQVMRDATDTTQVTVTIGAEHRLSGMTACSLVASGYEVRGARGAVGILGPTRMDYSRVMDLVESTARRLTEILCRTES